MAACPLCERESAHVHSENLSDEDHYTLWYALAATNPGTGYEREFKKADAALAMTQKDKRAIVQRRLQHLHEVGLLSLSRNGLGEYEPAQVHLDRLVGGRMVVGDWS